MTGPPPGLPRIRRLDTAFERAVGGVMYARSTLPLGEYPASLTSRLEYWAERAPDRTFLARRGADGRWQALTYAAAWSRTRRIAQALLDRRLSNDRPVAILSGNGLEHALLALASMCAGVLYAPIAPAYSLAAREYSTLRALWTVLRPGLVFADDGPGFERAIAAVGLDGAEFVTCRPPEGLPCTAFAELESKPATAAVDAAHARVTGDTIAKVLYTSGSTGRPKGVINTQRMLCSNQEMLRTVLPLLADPVPTLCDWLPWNHTFGGNHNFGIVLYNGGTLYIDDGKPTADGWRTTLANLREIAATAYFNVPRGYDLLVPALREDASFRDHFFSRLEMLFCAAAALRQQVADDLAAAARDAGRRVPLVTGLGATESAPFALCAGDGAFTGGRVGLPAPGVELKLAPAGGKLEGRLRGPSITPGYWRDGEMTRAAFDEEGYYCLGDALGFVDAADPSRGFVFEGRLSEDFKLSTGTWVRVGPLRAALLARLGDLVQDVVIAGHDRDFVSALIFPSADALRTLPADRLRTLCRARLMACAEAAAGGSTRVARALVVFEPPSIDAQELTEKGTVNQKAVLANRACLVERLYGPPSADIIDISESTGRPDRREATS